MTKPVLQKISEWITKQDWDCICCDTETGSLIYHIQGSREELAIIYRIISAVADYEGIYSRITYTEDTAAEVEVTLWH